MKKVVVEEIVGVTDGTSRESTGSNAIWAIALIIIVAIIAGAIYYSGILRNAPAGGPNNIKVDVSIPAA